MAPLLWTLFTIALLAGMLGLTQALDRWQSLRLIRRCAVGPLPPETVERLVAEECARLMLSSRDAVEG
jgi:hypothetical protein